MFVFAFYPLSRVYLFCKHLVKVIVAIGRLMYKSQRVFFYLAKSFKLANIFPHFKSVAISCINLRTQLSFSYFFESQTVRMYILASTRRRKNVAWTYVEDMSYIISNSTVIKKAPPLKIHQMINCQIDLCMTYDFNYKCILQMSYHRTQQACQNSVPWFGL